MQYDFIMSTIPCYLKISYNFMENEILFDEI